MGLSEDQKALLRLLAGGQGYEDIAALMGTSVDEVQAKARGAVEQLEAEGIPAPTLPGGPAKAAPVPNAPAEPEAEAAAPEPKAAPSAKAKPAPAPSPATPVPPPAAGKPGKRPKLKLPGGSGARAAIAGGIIVVALIVIIVLVSGGGGGDDSTASGTTSTTGSKAKGTLTARAEKLAQGKQVTKALLDPTDGSDATGIAIFGRVKKALALEISAEGLEQTGKNDSYTIWLAQSSQKMLPLASTAVPKSGQIGAQFEVPVEVLAYLANETFKHIVITHTQNAKLKTALNKATKEEIAPTYTGEEVLSGEVTGPIVGAQQRIEAAKKKKEAEKE
jgi:hypothetical protein